MILRKVIAAVLLCSMIGCYTVSPVAAPSTFIPQQNPERVWVTNELGETFLLERPMVRGDSIVGTLAATSEQFSVPLAAPGNRVFARQKSRSKTMQLIGSVGLLVGLTAFGLIVGSDGTKVCAQPGMRGCPPQ
jgi:hypothetical protein